MHLEIVTPDSTVYTGEIIIIQVPGSDGSFEVLNNHAPIISSLTAGKVKIVETNKEEKFFDISGGIIEVSKNKIILLAEKV